MDWIFLHKLLSGGPITIPRVSHQVPAPSWAARPRHVLIESLQFNVATMTTDHGSTAAALELRVSGSISQTLRLSDSQSRVFGHAALPRPIVSSRLVHTPIISNSVLHPRQQRVYICPICSVNNKVCLGAVSRNHILILHIPENTRPFLQHNGRSQVFSSATEEDFETSALAFDLC